MKKLLIVLLLFCLSIGGGYAQTPEIEESEAEETEETTEPVAEPTTKQGLDFIWRTSDLPWERPVLRAQRRLKRIDGSGQLPEGSARVGCVCMDYFVQQQIGQGACGGHNGVRFWLYAIPSGDTVQIATLRHESHPDTLQDSQLLQLAAYKRYERLMTQKQLAFFSTLEEHPDWLLDFLGTDPSDMHHQDSIRTPSPFSPVDTTAKNSVLYSLSVLIGSGALYVINKLRGETSTAKNKDDIGELPLPRDLI